MDEPAFAPTIARRVDRFLAPLQQPLRVREGAFFFRVTGGGKKENLGLDLVGLQFAAFDLGRVIPERSRLDFDHVADDKPFQARERFAFEPRVLRADRGILAHQEHPFHLAVEHLVEERKVGMVAGDFRHPFVAVIVLSASRDRRSRP